MATPDGKWANVISLNLQAFALFACLRAAQPSFALRVAVGVIIGLVLFASWTEASFTSEVSADFVRLATLCLVVIATPVVAWGLVRQVKERGSITVHTMLGVLCIYLLMCLAFAAAFGAITELSGDTFFSQGAENDTTNNFLYYSLTTITTVGMGDLSPATNLGRSVTGAEALFGQIYLVTVVAVIVANLRPKRTDG
jgi:hypothetical protein